MPLYTFFCGKNAPRLDSNSPRVAVAPRTRRKKKQKTKKTKLWNFFKSVSWSISTDSLDTLVCLCGGRNAKYMLERKRTLKYLQSLPNSSCEDATWAERVGGSIVGEREGYRSVINPWQEPSFGITFRYRHSPESSISAPYGSVFTNAGSKYSSYTHSRGSSGSSPQSNTDKASPSEHLNKNTTPTSLRNSRTTSTSTSGSTTLVNVPGSANNHDTPQSRSTSRKPRLVQPSIPCNLLPQVPRNRGGRPVLDLEADVRAICPSYGVGVDPILRPVSKALDLELERQAHEILSGNVRDAFKLPRYDSNSATEYVAFPQFSQNWNLPQYVITTDNPADPAVRWLRQNKQSAILRPDNLNVAPKHNVGDANMADFLTQRPPPKVDTMQATAEVVTIKVQQSKGILSDTLACEPEITISATGKQRANSIKPALGRKHSGGKQAINAAKYQAEVARAANAEYEKSQVVKGRKAAPTVERGKTKRRQTASTQAKRSVQATIIETAEPAEQQAKQTMTGVSSLMPASKPTAIPAPMHAGTSVCPSFLSQLVEQEKKLAEAKNQGRVAKAVSTYNNIYNSVAVTKQQAAPTSTSKNGIQTYDCAIASDTEEDDGWDPKWIVEQEPLQN
ncbi:hypothetical protein G7Y89_g8041 [Cudoniella acicularis]|uniref:Uncharacterized protein n=1 Tax=Cudoniella acicularis TaxID=354080 RepID=A0A8H4RHD8_9HELO|nr:hypothetical protein G7Y89_g8041 [Cudoniella acicularis]